MTSAFSSEIYMRKAEAALSGARLLLSGGDTDGTCSRAYYAMFDAAHAALFAIGAEQSNSPIKTHNGLIAKFSQHVVQNNHLAAEYGEAINKVQRVRQLADYTGDAASLNDATWAVEQATIFFEAIRGLIKTLSLELKM